MPVLCAQHNAQFVIKGRNKTEPLLNYVKYLHHIFKPVIESLTSVDRFEGPFYDYLQSPLQPLMDNLESSTYEVFEKDPVKYQRYEDAVHAALMDTPSDKVSLIMVVRYRCHAWFDGPV
jgi:type II protein arginine methyltransferase